jgi:rhodanese-related sulfurtransferase
LLVDRHKFLTVGISSQLQVMMIYRTALRLIGRPTWATPATGDDPLRDMALDVAARHPAINHMAPSELAAELAAQPDAVLVFDVRESGEFAVSHLANAIPLSPRGAQDLVTVRERLARRPDTKLAVFYCAVGVRSSALATRFAREAGSRNIGVANLAGGLFRWVNEGRAIVDGSGSATTTVHPFNRHWGQFLLR